MVFRDRGRRGEGRWINLAGNSNWGVAPRVALARSRRGKLGISRKGEGEKMKVFHAARPPRLIRLLVLLMDFFRRPAGYTKLNVMLHPDLREGRKGGSHRRKSGGRTDVLLRHRGRKRPSRLHQSVALLSTTRGTSRLMGSEQ